MVKTKIDLGALTKRLADEKFRGNLPDCVKGNWNGIPLKCVQDKENYYYLQDNGIFVQPKEGETGKDFVPYCFECKSPAKVLEVFHGPIAGRQPGNIIVEGGTHHSFYCIECEGEPGYGKLLNVELE